MVSLEFIRKRLKSFVQNTTFSIHSSSKAIRIASSALALTSTRLFAASFVANHRAILSEVKFQLAGIPDIVLEQGCRQPQQRSSPSPNLLIARIQDLPQPEGFDSGRLTNNHIETSPVMLIRCAAWSSKR